MAVNNITIPIVGKYAFVKTPYHKQFTSQIKKIPNAQWRRDWSAWSVPKEEVPRVRNIMREVFGYDDQDSQTETITLTIKKDISVPKRDIILFGKVIVHAWKRDCTAVCEEDVAFLNRHPAVCGTKEDWRCFLPAGSELILNNVLVSILSVIPPSEDYEWRLIGKTRIAADDLVSPAPIAPSIEPIVGQRTVNRITIDTNKTFTSELSLLSAEAGTNGYHGGDAAHGSRTYLRLAKNDESSIEFRRVNDLSGSAIGVEIKIGGDDELTAAIEALEFMLSSLKNQILMR